MSNKTVQVLSGMVVLGLLAWLIHYIIRGRDYTFTR